jgi:hypothetical protein
MNTKNEDEQYRNIKWLGLCEETHLCGSIGLWTILKDLLAVKNAQY